MYLLFTQKIDKLTVLLIAAATEGIGAARGVYQGSEAKLQCVVIAETLPM